FQGCTALQTAVLPRQIDAGGLGTDVFSGCKILARAELPDGLTKVPERFFYNCAALTVTLPETVTDIGAQAFSGCKALKEMPLPDGLVSVGEGAFQGCTSLVSIRIPEHTTDIGAGVFSSCESLTQAFFPENMTVIPESIFSRCTSLKEITLPQGLVTIGSSAFSRSGLSGEIIIPDGVTEIGADAFEHCAGITQVQLPEGLTTIGRRAFTYAGITSITIPSTVETVGGEAFMHAELLTVNILPGQTGEGWGASIFQWCPMEELVIPSTWTVVPESIFCSKTADIDNSLADVTLRRNTTLKKVVLPEGLKTISRRAFANCTALEEINFPSTLTTIDSEAFRTSGIPSLTLPAGLTSLGTGAFRECDNLQTVTIEHVNTILMAGLFKDCTALNTVVLAEGITRIPASFFENCTSLEHVTLPNSLREIEYNAFSNCTALSQITLPDGLTSIMFGAFEHCTSLTEITIPASVERMDALAFADSGLVSVTLDNDMRQDVFWYGEDLKSVVTTYFKYGTDWYNANVNVSEYSASKYDTEYYNSPFASCYHLEYINIPTTWTGLPAHFLHNCAGNLDLDIPDYINAIDAYALNNAGLRTLLVADRIAEADIGEKALSGNKMLQEVILPETWTTFPSGLLEGNEVMEAYTIPDHFTSIGERAFMGTALHTVEIPDGITSIGAQAFEGSKSLTSIILPEELEYLGEYAFMESGLTAIRIPPGIQTIGQGTFARCEDLEEVVIAEGITTIENMAFVLCESLKTVTVPDSAVKIHVNAFYGSNMGNVTILCNPGSAAESYVADCLYLGTAASPVQAGLTFSAYYHSHDYTYLAEHREYGGPWERFAFNLTVDGLNYLVEYSDGYEWDCWITCTGFVAEDSTITALYIPDYIGLWPVVGIGILAFDGQTQLTSIRLPTELTTIGSWAFRNTDVRELDFTSTKLEQVGNYAFYGNENLQNVTFRESVELLGEKSFANTALTEVTLPQTMYRLQLDAFDEDVIFTFTGDVTTTYNEYQDPGGTYHWVPVVNDLIDMGVQVTQFFGEGLDNQSTYLISTAGTSYSHTLADAATGSLPTDTTAQSTEANTFLGAPAAQQDTTSAQTQVELDEDAIVLEVEPQEPMDLEPEPEPEKAEVEIYEFVQNVGQENPAIIVIIVGAIAVIIALGAVVRMRKMRRERD
ncbi:MAG: leucine-rich repeat domain-containing protein, partial [Oscillospiraceae bacterium]|nr:leucine-rich repeat domain-containing protein [Oscillospiraceae bacterium]